MVRTRSKRIRTGRNGKEREKIRHLFDDGKNPRLIVVVSVGTNTNVHLLRKGVRFVRSCELEDTVVRRVQYKQKVHLHFVVALVHLSGGARGTWCQASVNSRIQYRTINTSEPPKHCREEHSPTILVEDEER